MNIRKLVATVVGALALTCATGFGQTLATSQVTGSVTDASGAVVPSAIVQMTQIDTGDVHTTKSNASGTYIVPDLAVGPYRLQVTAQGFSTYVQNGIVLEISTNPVINVKLAVGNVTQQVVVESSALMVETQSNGVGQVIDQKQVVDLPLNGRDPTQLIALAGATTTAPSGDLNSNKNFPTITIAVAGGLPNGVAYILDGGSHNDPFNNLNLPLPFPDALQEFKVETNSLPAQYGDHASAAVNAVTKSGGNKFHGDLFEFVRNYAFNAAPFFSYNSVNGTKTRDSLKRNQFGGTLGGPIKHDKLFFFGGYQDTINRQNPSGNFVQVPTEAMLHGDFSVINSPACGRTTPLTLPAPFATVRGVPYQVNPSLFSSQALTALKYIPIAASPGYSTTSGLNDVPDVTPSANSKLSGNCGYVSVSVPANSTTQEGLGKIDYNISEKNRVFGRYFLGIYNAPVPQVTGNALASNAVSQYNRDHSLTIGQTYSFTPNIINAVRLTGKRTLGLRSVAPFFDPSILGINAYNRIPGFMGLSVTNGFSLGGGATNPGYFNSTSEQFTDDVSWITGSHQFLFGVSYIYALMDTVNNRPANGTYSFDGSVYGGGQGQIGYADFLLGTLSGSSAFSQGNPDLENDGQTYFALYAQDSWKASRRVSVNYGLRWEPYTPEHNSNGHVENFSMANFNAGIKSTVFTNAPAGMTFQGDPGYPGNHYTYGNYGLLEPRIGIIVDPTGDGKMSLRAGYGIFFDSPQMFFNTRYSNSPPYGTTISLSGPLPFANPWATYAGGNPFPALNNAYPTVPFPTFGVYVNSPLHIKPMYLQQWNLSLQRQVGSWLLGATYLGNTTKHLPTSYEANPAIYIAGNSTGVAGSCGPAITNTATGLPKAGSPCSSTSNTNFRRLLYQANPSQGQYYATIGQYDDGGVANYNGALVSVQHRGANFDVVANYTYAHCLSEAETTELTGPSYPIPPATNPRGKDFSYSNCDSDRRNVANASFIARSPHFTERYTRLLAGGWQLSTILTATSGGFGTVSTGTDVALSGIGTQMAHRIGNPYNSTASRFGSTGYLTVSAYQPAATMTPGTYAPDRPLTIRGRASYELDMGIARNFRVPRTESNEVQFRWEVFNVPNEAIFTGTGAAALNSTSFGNFTATGNPRIMQLALKYLF